MRECNTTTIGNILHGTFQFVFRHFVKRDATVIAKSATPLCLSIGLTPNFPVYSLYIAKMMLHMVSGKRNYGYYSDEDDEDAVVEESANEVPVVASEPTATLNWRDHKNSSRIEEWANKHTQFRNEANDLINLVTQVFFLAPF